MFNKSLTLFILGGLLLSFLMNPVTVGASETGEIPQLVANGVGDFAPLTAGSEMGPISAGLNHTCALTSSGGVACWGNNMSQQLGNNMMTHSHVPVMSQLITGASAIAAGGMHVCALTTTGGVLCWGDNSAEQLGNITPFWSTYEPVSVFGLSSGVSAIAAGHWHTCALTTTGGAMCWGSNSDGQLGNNSNTGGYTPVNVSGLTSGVTAIAVGGGHSCALTATGGVMCWGSNSNGQLGNNNSNNPSPIPVNVVGLSSGVVAIAAGSSHTCALTALGGIKCWGNNQFGQLGNNTFSDESLLPVDVVGLPSGVVSIATGEHHTCALTSTGGMMCWGDNDNGQLGNNSLTVSAVPVNVSGLSSGVSYMTGARWHTCALTSDGGGMCWGANDFGQLGDGTDIRSLIPVYISGMAPVPTIFTDVPSTYWAWEYIERLYNAGITSGCSASPMMYCPEATVTRAQMAIFILRGVHGSSYIPPAATGTVFADVPLGSFAADWIEQLASEGVTAGCGGGNYCPDATITRAQMAIFLLRGEHGSSYVPPAATGMVFGDVPLGSFADAWIEQLAAEGVTSGCGGGNYCPDANVTRAEMAVFLVRAFSLP